MDRPTCATCPYWERDADEREGYCHRLPPAFRLVPTDDYVQPWTWETDWCGEHPDFPAFLESRKAPAVNPGDAMYWDEHGQRCMRLTTPPTAPPSPPPTPRE